MTKRWTTRSVVSIIGAVWLALFVGGLTWAADAPPADAPAPAPPAKGPFIQLGIRPGATKNEASSELPQVFSPLRRDLKRSLSRAEEALAERRYADAATELDALLNGPDVEDYFIESSEQQGTRTSLKATVRRLLGSMPENAREVYELQFGAEARRLLTEGIESGDVEKLTEASRRYFQTRSGHEATLLAGHYLLNQGQALAAAILLQRFDEAPSGATGQLEPELSLLRAICWRLAGNTESAEKAVRQLGKQSPNATITVRGQPARIIDLTTTPANRNPEDQSLALAWLDELIGARGARQRSSESEWLLYRGNHARNAISDGGQLLSRPRWQVPTANDWNDEQHIRALSKQFVDQSHPAMSSLQPLAVGDVVLMRSPNELLAVDFKTGKRVWLYPWDTDLASWASDGPLSSRGFTSPVSQGATQASRRRMELHQRIWEDAAYGQLSSDGNALFLIDELDFATAPGLTRLARGAFGAFGANGATSNNRLVALDLQTQGKLLWAIGRARDGYPGDEPRLADAFFLGAPLPLSDQLFVLTEIKGEVRLVVLDARTGSLQWSQQLAHFEAPQQAVDYDSRRRLAAATPSFADGVLVCPVSAGAVVGVDVATRSLRWGYQYPTGSGGRTRRMGPWNQGLFVEASSHHAGNRWADATATIAQGRVLLTPVESGQLHCLDLVTGNPAWPPQKRGDNLYVAGVHDGTVVLVGQRQISAIRLADGGSAWKKPIQLPSNALPSGRGFLSDGQYFLPTTAPDLLRVDVSDGTWKAKRLDFMLGNLICHQGQIISQNARHLEAFYQFDSLKTIVDRRLQEDSEDPWALEHQALLLIDQGQPSRALKPLRRALELYSDGAPRRDAAQSLLVDTLLDALREDFVANRALADEVNKLIEQPRQRDEYLRLMAEGLERSGQNARAFERYLEIAASQASRSNQGQAEFLEDDMMSVGRELQVHRDRWLAGVFERLLRSASEEDRSQILANIESLSQAAQEADTVSQLRTFIAHFGSHSIADSARMRLARRLFESEQLLEAELTVKRLTESTDPLIAAPAVALTAQLLEYAERFQASAFWYRQLSDQYRDVMCLEGKTGEQVFQSLSDSSQVALALRTSYRWPDGRVVTKQIKPSPAQRQNIPLNWFNSRQMPIEISQADPSLTEMAGLVLSSQLDSIGMIDGTGHPRRYVTLEYPDRRITGPTRNGQVSHAKLHGHLMLMSLGTEIVAIDALSMDAAGGMEVLWREALSPRLTGVSSTARRLGAKPVTTYWGEKRYTATEQDGRPVGRVGTATGQGICYQVGRELRCVDPLTRRLLWVRGVVAPGSHLFGDDQRVFAVAPKATKARVFSRVDGQELEARTVPPETRRWTTIGRRILVWDHATVADQPVNLRLYDPWTEHDIWSHKFAAGSKGWVVAGEAVGVMQTDGRFLLVSLLDGSKIVDAELEPEKTLANVWVLSRPDHYLLVTSNPSVAARTSMIATSSHVFSRHVNGRIYSFDRRTGEMSWPGPVVVKDYAMPPGQPPGIPVLTFLRNVTSTQSGQSRRKSCVLCIDSRDGRALLDKNDFASNIYAFDVTGTAEDNQVTIRLNASPAFRFQFTDEPRDAEPPAQTGTQSSDAKDGVSSRLSKIAEAVADALGRHSQRLLNPVADPSGAQVPVPPVPKADVAPLAQDGTKND